MCGWSGLMRVDMKQIFQGNYICLNKTFRCLTEKNYLDDSLKRRHSLKVIYRTLERPFTSTQFDVILLHGRLSPSARHRVVYRKMCRRFPVVLQEIQK